jgi:hypothetical protein
VTWQYEPDGASEPVVLQYTKKCKFGLSGCAERLVNKYDVGSQYTIYYNPNNYRETTSSTDYPNSYMAVVIVVTLLMGMPLMWLLMRLFYLKVIKPDISSVVPQKVDDEPQPNVAARAAPVVGDAPAPHTPQLHHPQQPQPQPMFQAQVIQPPGPYGQQQPAVQARVVGVLPQPSYQQAPMMMEQPMHHQQQPGYQQAPMVMEHPGYYQQQPGYQQAPMMMEQPMYHQQQPIGHHPGYGQQGYQQQGYYQQQPPMQQHY